MAAREELILGDREKYPDEAFLSSILGDKMTIWETIMKYTRDNYTNITGEWRYYNDGKQWLFKLQQKKKTIFWAGVVKGTFRVTFYLGGKAANLISNSSLSDRLKADFMENRQPGKFQSVTIRISGPSDLDDIYKLIEIKIKQK
jgi:hypothetical protein